MWLATRLHYRIQNSARRSSLALSTLQSLVKRWADLDLSRNVREHGNLGISVDFQGYVGLGGFGLFSRVRVEDERRESDYSQFWIHILVEVEEPRA